MTEPPRAPLATALVAVIGVGAVAGARGVWDIAKARAIAKDANARHEQALAKLEAVQKPVHERVAEYGSQQLSVISEVNGRFADWIERNQMAVNRLGYEYVDGLDIAVTEPSWFEWGAMLAFYDARVAADWSDRCREERCAARG